MKKILYMAAILTFSVMANAQIDRSKQPKPGAAPTINLTKPQSFVLPNGLTVMVVENHKLPTVSFSLSLDNPPSLEGALKGVEDITSSMMGNGTSKISKDGFNRKIEYFGANVNFSIGGVGGSCLSKYFAQVLPLVAQGALDPLFTEEDMKNHRDKITEGLKAEEKSAQGIAKRVRGALLFGKNHPNGEILTPETLGKVTLADVKKCYATNFVPTKAYLVVVGDVKYADVKKLITTNFSSWKKSALPVSKYTDPVNVAKTEINFVDVPNAVQSEIAVANLVDFKMSSPDFFAALLANQILGSTDSRLFNNLRERHGWTYGAYSGIKADKYLSSFAATASVRNLVTDSAIVEIMRELDTIRTQLPTAAELELAKAKYLGNFVMTAGKPETIARFALNEKTQNLPVGFYENYIKNLNAVTLEQVRTAAKKYFSRDNARIIVVGKASDVLPKLEGLNIPIRYFDKDGNEIAKPQAKKADAGVSVESILTKYISAIGGEKAIGEVKSIFFISKASIQGQEMTTTVKQTASGKAFMEVNVMGMSLMKTVFDGTKGYTIVQGQRKDLDGQQLEDAKEGMIPELDLLKSGKAKLAGIESINGSDAYKVTAGGSKIFFYDAKTGLKVAQETTVQANGQSMTQRVLMSDYKPAGSILIPYKSTVNMMGMEIAMDVTSAKVNEGVADTDFQ